MIPVLWHAQPDGRGFYNSSAMLNWMFDQYPCKHYGVSKEMVELNGAGAVVVVHGGRELDGLERLNSDIERMAWALIIVMGDEENSFPVEKIVHPNKRIWIQEPMPGRHDFANRFIIDGYGHDHNSWIAKVPKDFLWFFGGQVTNDRRRACVDALRKLDWGGMIIETRGYHLGISLREYYLTLCRAKIVPCPSGPHSPDTARIWDSLEAGCIPILDDLSPTRKEPGFWKYVLGEHPLPVLTDWSTLPDVIHELEQNWEEKSLQCQSWWLAYKFNYSGWLATDLWKLGVPCTKS